MLRTTSELPEFGRESNNRLYAQMNRVISAAIVIVTTSGFAACSSSSDESGEKAVERGRGVEAGKKSFLNLS
jgi:hypothetical protein